MNGLYDYKKFAILYVDDEEKSLKYFTRAFEEHFHIYTATTAQEGLNLLEARAEDIGILMTDQRMPGEKGTWLLEKARQLRPRIIRILVTAYSDMEAAIAAVNTGAIYKYISKPWDPPALESTLKHAMEFFIVQRERDQLLREKMAVLHNLMIADRIVSLGLLAAGLSHHIRNSLVAVKTFLDLAPMKLQEENLNLQSLRHPDFWKEYYHNVQSQVQRINTMLKDLSAASQQPGFIFQDRVHLHEVVAEAAERLRESLEEKRITVQVQVPQDLPPLTVDQHKFHRLFELLLRDEIVSLPPDSTVTIRAQPGAAAGCIEVELHDNGPGLPQEALRLIFDPFVVRTDSPLEYGINLMACYFIVHHHGGKIEARSAPGQGTTFTLHLLTNPEQQPMPPENNEFLQKVLLNETLWEKLLSSPG